MMESSLVSKPIYLGVEKLEIKFSYHVKLFFQFVLLFVIVLRVHHDCFVHKEKAKNFMCSPKAFLRAHNNTHSAYCVPVISSAHAHEGNILI